MSIFRLENTVVRYGIDYTPFEGMEFAEWVKGDGFDGEWWLGRGMGGGWKVC